MSVYKKRSLARLACCACDWSIWFLVVEQSFLYDTFCRQHLLVLIRTWLKVLIAELALRPVRVAAQKLKKTLVYQVVAT